MNFDEFCKGSFTKWDGEPPEGVKTWDRERGRFVDPFIMNYEPKIYGRRADAKSTTHTYDILKELLKSTTIPDTRDTYKMANIINEGENTMPTNYNEFFTTGRLYMANVFLPKIKDVIFNPPATIVLWDDNSKTVVKAQNGEPYDPEKGMAMCIVKKIYGNKGKYFNNISKWVEKYWEKEAEKDKGEQAIIDEPTIIRRMFFTTRECAEKTLSCMKEIRDKHGVVTQADISDMFGLVVCPEDTEIGWTSLRGSSIKKNDTGYYVYLPKPNWTKE